MRIQIVALDVPTPPNYGGAVDMFWRIAALAKSGVEIVLHAFTYDGRKPSTELRSLCRSVHLYPRHRNPLLLLHPLPYMTLCRRHPQLTRNLLASKDPILLEGVHTASLLLEAPELGRRAIIRTHNIESTYYQHLAHDERSLPRRLLLQAEAHKLAKQECRLLSKCSGIAAISTGDREALVQSPHKLPPIQVVGPFHGRTLAVPEGLGAFALFQANLAVPENHNAAQMLIREASLPAQLPLIVAGRQPRPELRRMCTEFQVQLVADPDETTLHKLVQEASVHLIPGERGDGVKLKLLRALFEGRHVVVSPNLVSGSPLSELCHHASSPEQFRDLALHLASHAVPAHEIERRNEVLQEHYSDMTNATRLIGMLEPLAIHL